MILPFFIHSQKLRVLQRVLGDRNKTKNGCKRKLDAIISKKVLFILSGNSSSPNVVNGGGFVVTDCSQKVVFRVDGSGVLGKKDELLLKNGNGDALLLIRRTKDGRLVVALSIYKQWRGYTLEFVGSPRPAFTVKQPNSCIVNQNLIKISIDERECNNNKRDFEIKGYFPDKACSIIDSKGNVGQNAEVDEVMASNDLYHVEVKTGIGQAFVFRVISVLDFMNDGSTRCFREGSEGTTVSKRTDYNFPTTS